MVARGPGDTLLWEWVLLRLWRWWWFSCIPLLAALASPFAKRRGGGVLCFFLGSRVRGNDGGLRE